MVVVLLLLLLLLLLGQVCVQLHGAEAQGRQRPPPRPCCCPCLWCRYRPHCRPLSWGDTGVGVGAPPGAWLEPADHAVLGCDEGAEVHQGCCAQLQRGVEGLGGGRRAGGQAAARAGWAASAGAGTATVIPRPWSAWAQPALWDTATSIHSVPRARPRPRNA